jgi:hypothetical protein
MACPREGLGYRVDVASLERLVRRLLDGERGAPTSSSSAFTRGA